MAKRKDVELIGDKIKVTALPAFMGRRFMTLLWPDQYKDLFRILKAGGVVEIDKQYFDSTILEVTNGND
jgi:hypothetical protein